MEATHATVTQSSLTELCDKYRKFVISNHGIVGNIESAIRIFSYFAPGRGEHSVIFAELLYSASNLLVFMNDAILRQAANVKLKVPLARPALSRWLAVLEHVEVFLEIAAHGLGGDVYRWIIVVCVQVAKAALKFLLLLRYDSGLQQTPQIPPLKRDRHLQRRLQEASDGMTPDVSVTAEVQLDQPSHRQTFTLKRSGRNIRTLESAPPLLHRSWKVPSESAVDGAPVGGGGATLGGRADPDTPTALQRGQLLGECLHISRPLAHLLSMYLFGQHSWKPWLVACGMDVSSLHCLGELSAYSGPERDEIRRRTLLLSLYMLRSPFYDRHAKTRIISVLQGMARYIPGARLAIRPLLDYLPWWQRVYFYVWMT